MKWKKIFTREYGVLYPEIIMRSISSEGSKFFPFYLSKSMMIPYGKNESFYAFEKEYDKLSEKLVEKYALDQNTYNEFSKVFHDLGQKNVDSAKKLSEGKISFSTYLDIWKNYTSLLWIGMILNDVFEEKGRDLISSKKISADTLFVPKEKSSIHLLNEKIGKVDEKDLWKEFEWLPCLDVHNAPWKYEEFKDYIRNYRHREFSENMLPADISPEDLDIVRMVRNFVYIKDKRDEFRRKGVFYLRKYFEKLGIDPKDASFMLSAEFERPIDKDVINRRKKGYLMIFDGNAKCYTSDAKILEIKEKSSISEKIGDLSIKGVTGSRGKAKGFVRIVEGVHDLLKVQKGDIMVAVTTHPDFVPKMSISSAIVTDEGGATSHAAIVCRELDIPCIVGAGNATKTLQDGSLVEVNADEGTVKLINQK